MDTLTADQKRMVKEYLHHQGLSFKPLQDEMMDHLCCDIESRMSQGCSFDKAWRQVTDEIEEHHFQTIQQNVMETINKRFTWSQGLSFLALALLLISGLFKVMHLQFSGELLLVAFGLIAASLLTTTLTGVFLNRGKHGAARVLSLVIGVIVLLIGFAFKILHLAGADQFIVVAVSVLVMSLVANTIYVYRSSSGHSNLLTFLHEKYTPGIERFLMILLVPLTVYQVITILQEDVDVVGRVMLLVVMFGSGLQFIAMCWRIMEENSEKRNPLTFAATIISAVCLTLPFLGPLVPFELRVVIILTFTATSAWLAYTVEVRPRRLVTGLMTCLVPAIFTGWALIHLGVIALDTHAIFFNIPVLVILLAGLVLCRKHGAMRAYMLIAVSSYLFEYIV